MRPRDWAYNDSSGQANPHPSRFKKCEIDPRCKHETQDNDIHEKWNEVCYERAWMIDLIYLQVIMIKKKIMKLCVQSKFLIIQ
jgi:hypothetical protein